MDDVLAWYCLIGFNGLESFPWIAEQRGLKADACEISRAIKIPGTKLNFYRKSWGRGGGSVCVCVWEGGGRWGSTEKGLVERQLVHWPVCNL